MISFWKWTPLGIADLDSLSSVRLTVDILYSWVEIGGLPHAVRKNTGSHLEMGRDLARNSA